MKTRLLRAYAELMCRAIWAARKVFPPANDIPVPNFLLRDWEWTSDHYCEMCGHKGRHTFIEWMPERVVTATCGLCGFEGTLL